MQMRDDVLDFCDASVGSTFGRQADGILERVLLRSAIAVDLRPRLTNHCAWHGAGAGLALAIVLAFLVFVVVAIVVVVVL